MSCLHIEQVHGRFVLESKEALKRARNGACAEAIASIAEGKKRVACYSASTTRGWSKLPHSFFFGLRHIIHDNDIFTTSSTTTGVATNLKYIYIDLPRFAWLCFLTRLATRLLNSQEHSILQHLEFAPRFVAMAAANDDTLTKVSTDGK